MRRGNGKHWRRLTANLECGLVAAPGLAIAMVPEVGGLIGGRYELVRLLDQGGMGAVWVARDDSRGTNVAIKLLNNSLVHRSASRRFRREARALEQIDHENVVETLGHGVDGGVPFIVMELLEGETLRSWLQRRGALPPGHALELLRQTAAGLTAAHGLGIVHRDVKPSNLFLCATEAGTVVKIIDFGIAAGDTLDNDSQASSTGFIGSPAYMSPEQARAESIDRQTDVWSLSVVAFQMLTGREAFAGANVPETLQRICSGPIPLASKVASGLPAGVDALFARAFASKRSERFQDVGQLVTELESVCRSAPDRAAISLSPPARPGRSATTASYQLDSRSKLQGSSVRTASFLLAAAAALVFVWQPVSSPPLRSSLVRPAITANSTATPSTPVSASPSFTQMTPAPALDRALMAATPAIKAGRIPARVLSPIKANGQAPKPPESRPVDLDPVFGLAIDRSHGPDMSSRSRFAARSDSQLDGQALR